jgi:NitT/TauT family transport system substrate-binding protein
MAASAATLEPLCRDVSSFPRWENGRGRPRRSGGRHPRIPRTPAPEPGRRRRQPGPPSTRLCRVLATAAAAFLLLVGPMASETAAADVLHVGKAVPEAFSFTPLDIGIRQGFFRNNGLEIQETAFAGDAKLQQAMASNSIDIGIGSGPALAFIVKGAPIKGVAAMAGPPLLLAIVVRPDGAHSPADLKGKKVSVSTAGSLTYWLVSETSRRQGWGPHGIVIAPMGAMAGQIAALRRGDIDGVIMDVANAYDLEKRGEGRILVRFGDVHDFITHVIFATDKLIASRPESIRNFLKGWFATIAFMRANKAEAVKIAAQVLQKDADIVSRAYDDVMPMFSEDGRFRAKPLAVLATSFVEMGTLPAEPDMSKLYTEAFLPGR